jgi:hypothetical protein
LKSDRARHFLADCCRACFNGVYVIDTHALIEHTAAPEQLDARKELLEMFEQHPMSPQDELFNIGLFVRSGVLAKFLVMNDLYKRFLNVPGLLMEFGVWFGQNLVLLENLRAIWEPFNKFRRIVGFDTFSGYPDRLGYNTGEEYESYLARLLKVHQRCNIYGHQKINHELIKGNVCVTVPQYFKDNPGAIVAFAYFDIGPFDPTYAALKALKPHLAPGAVLLMDQFTWPEEPGEAEAFKAVFGQTGYRIEKCAIYPSKAIVTVE